MEKKNTPSRRTLGRAGVLSVAQTREIRNFWKHGSVSAWRFNVGHRWLVRDALLEKKMIELSPDGKYYILTNDTALDIAIWLRDHPGERF